MPKFPLSRRWLALIAAVLAVALLWPVRSRNAHPVAAGLRQGAAATQARPISAETAPAIADAAAPVVAAPPATPERALFSYVRPANAAALDAALPAPTREIRY